jgi:hypothetical protein
MPHLCASVTNKSRSTRRVDERRVYSLTGAAPRPRRLQTRASAVRRYNSVAADASLDAAAYFACLCARAWSRVSARTVVCSRQLLSTHVRSMTVPSGPDWLHCVTSIHMPQGVVTKVDRTRCALVGLRVSTDGAGIPPALTACLVPEVEFERRVRDDAHARNVLCAAAAAADTTTMQ